MKLKTNDIARSLSHNPVTRAKVTNTNQANYVIETATNAWIKSLRGNGWVIYHLSLSLNLTRTQELGLQYTNTIDYGKASPSLFHRFSCPDPDLLFIIETDLQTPQWAYEITERMAQHSTSRILSIDWQTHLLL